MTVKWIPAYQTIMRAGQKTRVIGRHGLGQENGGIALVQVEAQSHPRPAFIVLFGICFDQKVWYPIEQLGSNQFVRREKNRVVIGLPKPFKMLDKDFLLRFRQPDAFNAEFRGLE